MVYCERASLSPPSWVGPVVASELGTGCVCEALRGVRWARTMHVSTIPFAFRLGARLADPRPAKRWLNLGSAISTSERV